ncbi:MAG TPA: hypothetical protein VFH59_13130 [Frateuria sp.]|uniref:hypothetical protein n=1 Tax=Frateuria sp. TaxID=2211372 RepID=UPI002D7E6909|nr:hypothetical protein [Frateuria sp.]HET6806373.1 hypothetical protein [Frateuria sp.]
MFYQYPGSPRQASDEAVIFFQDSDGVLVRDLDGKELANPLTTWNGGYAAVREIHVLPGIHTVLGSVSRGGGFAPYALREDFQAGRRYHLMPVLYGYSLKVTVIDTTDTPRE